MSQQFLIGPVCIVLAHALARVALALHFAQRNTPLGVTTQDQITNLQVMTVFTNVKVGDCIKIEPKRMPARSLASDKPHLIVGMRTLTSGRQLFGLKFGFTKEYKLRMRK